jgi:hypothetical protein
MGWLASSAAGWRSLIFKLDELAITQQVLELGGVDEVIAHTVLLTCPHVPRGVANGVAIVLGEFLLELGDQGRLAGAAGSHHDEEVGGWLLGATESSSHACA